MFEKIKNWLNRNEKIEPPVPRAIIKMTDLAKERGIIDDENKIIEFHDGRDVKIIKYTPEEVDILMQKGIPVLPESYSDEFKFLNSEEEGSVDSYLR